MRATCLALTAGLFLGGCAALNLAYDDGSESGSTSVGVGTSEGPITTTSGSDATSVGGDATSVVTSTTDEETSTGDSAGEEESSSSGDPNLCEPDGFGLKVGGLAECSGEGSFVAELCVSFSALEGSEDGVRLSSSPVCACDGMIAIPVEAEFVASGHPLAELVLAGQASRCGMLRLSGVGNGTSECDVRSAFFFDSEDSADLRLAFSNDVFLFEPLRAALVEVGLEPVASPAGEGECGSADPVCPHAAGVYDIALATGSFALPNGSPVEVELPTSGGPHPVRLYNFGSRVLPPCEQSGKWAAIWDELAYAFP